MATEETSTMASSTFDGFYQRPNLASAGQVPASGPYAQCPDIIRSASPVARPQRAFGSAESWQTRYSTAPVAGEENHYYLRGANGGSGDADVQLALYAAPAQLIPFPTTWQGSPLRAADGALSVPASAGPGEIGVASTPFVWSAPAAVDGIFHGFVGHATPAGGGGDIPVVDDWLGMSALQTRDLTVGFDTVAEVDATAATWTRKIGLTIPSSLAGAGTVTISVASAGFAGASVGLIADRFTDAGADIVMQPFTLDDRTLRGLSIELQPGYAAELTVQVWSKGSQPKPGATITVSADYQIPQAEAGRAAALGVVDPQRQQLLQAAGAVGPTPVALLGMATFVAT